MPNQKCLKFFPSFKFIFLFFLVDGQIGEGIVTPEKLEVTKDSETAGDGTVGDDTSLGKRPESATSGELSSLNPEPNNPNVDQSPARSPHARSWTVPGVYM